MTLLGLAVVLAIAISICLRLRRGGRDRSAGQRSWIDGFGARMGKGGEGSRDSDMEGEADTANLVPARESACA